MTSDQTIGQRIAAARSQKGLEQKDLAVLLRLKNTAQISQWENDVRVPRPARLSQLAAALDTTESWLISGSGNRPISGSDSGRASGDRRQPRHVGALINVGAIASQIVAAETGASEEEILARVGSLMIELHEQVRRAEPSWNDEDVFGFVYITLRKEQRRQSPPDAQSSAKESKKKR